MIKFGETPDVHERQIDKLEKKYTEIKPSKEMTEQETADFITREFQKVKIEPNKDEYEETYNRLLSEAFNRTTEDVEVDFEIDSDIQDVLNRIMDDGWGEKSDGEKLSLMKELVDIIGSRLNMDNTPEIVVFEEDEAYGSYDARKNTINLNKDFFNDRRELINTIAHEMRHAYQHYRIQILETWEDALYLVNFDNYISPVPLPNGGWLFFVDYLNQYVEVEARVFADLFTEAVR